MIPTIMTYLTLTCPNCKLELPPLTAKDLAYDLVSCAACNTDHLAGLILESEESGLLADLLTTIKQLYAEVNELKGELAHLAEYLN